jgi:two-component system, NtrC family, response regulator PilR
MSPTNRSGTRMRSVAPVLVVEDDPVMSKTVCQALIDEGYLVVSVATLAAARSALERCKPSVMVLDLTLPDSFGGDLLAELADQDDAPPTVILSVFHLASMVADRYDVELVRKPFEMQTFLDAVRKAQEDSRRPSRVAL